MKLRKKLIPFLVLTACLVLFLLHAGLCSGAYGSRRGSGSCQSGKGGGNRKCLRLVPVCHCLFKGIPEN